MATRYRPARNKSIIHSSILDQIFSASSTRAVLTPKRYTAWKFSRTNQPDCSRFARDRRLAGGGGDHRLGEYFPLVSLMHRTIAVRYSPHNRSQSVHAIGIVSLLGCRVVAGTCMILEFVLRRSAAMITMQASSSRSALRSLGLTQPWRRSISTNWTGLLI